jgi:hypothetical protein
MPFGDWFGCLAEPWYGALSGGQSLPSSRMEVPLAAILGQHIIDIDFYPTDHRPGIRHGGNDALV